MVWKTLKKKYFTLESNTKKTADDVERFAIAKERALGKAEYNIADGGTGGSIVKGTKFSEEHKRKISEALKGRCKSEETRKKLSEANKGKHISEEQRKKHSEALRGKKRGVRSEEWKMHLSESLKGRAAWNKGKRHSDETKRKISEARKGKKMSDEARKKMSETRKGRIAWNKGLHWYNNGEISLQAKECPEGFVKGRLYKLVDGKRVWY